MDGLFALLKVIQDAADWTIKNWPAITNAIANLVAATYVLTQVLGGLLPFLEKAWEIIKSYFNFGYKVGSETVAGVGGKVKSLLPDHK